jgi:hypothetical protein
VVRALCFTGAALACLVAAQPASAQNPDISDVAVDTCQLASNQPVALFALMLQQFNSFEWAGADDKFCDKFVKEAVKACFKIVSTVTKCRVPLQDAQGEYFKIPCAEEGDKDAIKACEKNIEAETTDANNVATQVVQLLGNQTCEQDFADDVLDVCLNGLGQ